MHLVEICFEEEPVIDTRELKWIDAWHDEIYNINYADTGMWMYDGKSIKLYDETELDLKAYIYFVTFNTQVEADVFVLGFITGGLIQKWENKRLISLN